MRLGRRGPDVHTVPAEGGGVLHVVAVAGAHSAAQLQRRLDRLARDLDGDPRQVVAQVQLDQHAQAQVDAAAAKRARRAARSAR